jgi:hypothetical protein
VDIYLGLRSKQAVLWFMFVEGLVGHEEGGD